MSYRKLIAASLTLAALLVSTAAPAQYRGRGGNYARPGYAYDNGRPGYGDGRDYGRGQGRYAGRDERVYGRNGRSGRCDRGTGGTILGAIAGGLLGNSVAGRRGDRDAGTIVGAGVGALAGRAIDRDC